MEDQTQQTTNRTGQMFTTAGDLFWDTWLQSLGTMTWASDQAEKLVRTWMDQGRVSREEGIRLQREMIEQARANQRQLQDLISRSVQEQTETLRTTMQQQLDELRQRIDQMNAELREYRDRVAQ